MSSRHRATRTHAPRWKGTVVITCPSFLPTILPAREGVLSESSLG
jgi:hypothetical protein